MPFLRVRSARKGDPQHEFYVSTDQVEADPATYEVLEPDPVDVPGAVVYVAEQKAQRAPRAPKAPARRPKKPSPAAAGESKSGGEVKENTDDS